MAENRVLHGPVLTCGEGGGLLAYEDAYLVCENGVTAGIFEELPEEYAEFPLEDFWDKLIIPGMTDLKASAPRFNVQGIEMDLDPDERMSSLILPEEAAAGDIEYAEQSFDFFVENLYLGPVTRAVVTGSRHTSTVLGLMDMLDNTGMMAKVGRLFADAELPKANLESTERAVANVSKWLDRVKRRHYRRVEPILSPAGAVFTTPELKQEIRRAAEARGVPVLAEVPRIPDSLPKGVLISGLSGEEFDSDGCRILRDAGAFVVCCPGSDALERGTVIPSAKLLRENVRTGFGSDTGMGIGSSLFEVMREAALLSGLAARKGHAEERLGFADIFYMATAGGGAFFGKTGSFLPGYEFDAVILDDENLQTMTDPDVAGRVERVIRLGDDRNVVGKYVQGRKIY